MKSYFVLLALLLCSVSQAHAVTISDQRCVSASNEDVIKAVTDYPSYSKIPEAKFDLKGMHVLDMADSQVIVEKSHDDSLVRIELVPLNLSDRSVYPHFILRCEVSRESETKSKHTCHLLTEDDLKEYYHHEQALPPSFGLKGFTSELEIDSANGCPSGQTHLSYHLEIEPQQDDVDKIQKAWTASLHSQLASMINGFPIPESLFFQTYYEGFYKGWANRIEKH